MTTESVFQDPPSEGTPKRGIGRLCGAAALLAVAWAVVTGVLILCGEAVVHSAAIKSWDRQITTNLVAHRSAGLTAVMKTLTWAGSWIAVFVLACLVVVLVWRRRLPGVAVFLVVTMWLGELFAVTLTKSVVRRERPPEAVRLVAAHGWSFPSGHTANAVVVFVVLSLVISAFVERHSWQFLTWCCSALVIGLVGFSRIELAVHWTSDVVASLIWTVGWVLTVVVVAGRTKTDNPAGFRLSARSRPGS
jgi:membrane-associated phospholipid phosphatase